MKDRSGARGTPRKVSRSLRATDALVDLGTTPCDRRVWVKANRVVEPWEPNELKVALADLGLEHERRYADASFPERLDQGERERWLPDGVFGSQKKKVEENE